MQKEILKEKIKENYSTGVRIDAFLASKLSGKNWKVIVIDMIDEMLEKARKTSVVYNYKNIEFRKGDIEQKIPIENNSGYVVISNCVINLTSNKTNTLKEIYRFLKKNGNAKKIISNMVTTKEINNNNINTDNWCSFFDNALTKENYLHSIKDAGFQNIEILNEHTWMKIILMMVSKSLV
jgi:ubiquinone/menaquinone biosynthesis C-methylase UbiE